MKKFSKLSVFIALMLVLVLAFSACGDDEKGGAGDNSNESKSIRVFFADTAKTDNEEVSDAVSKMSKEKIGVEVEMVFFGAGEYAQKMPKLLATNEQMDIGWHDGNDFVTYARDGAFYNIKDDLNAYPELKNLFGDVFLKGVTVDGGVYGIPTLKEMAEVWTLWIEQPVLDKHNIKAESIKSLADAEIILEALKADGRQGFFVSHSGAHKAFALLKEYDTITGLFVISNDDSIAANKKKIVNWVNTDNFAEFATLLRDWYNKGYISKDVVENGSETYGQITTADKTKHGLTWTSYSPCSEYTQSKNRGVEMTPLYITEPTTSNGSARGSIYCIYNKSENKQSSLKFLQLWNTDVEMNTLIKFGIEGKHYNFVEEDGIKKVKKVDNANDMFSNQNWRTGNVLISQIEQGEPANKYEEYEKFNESARESCVLGFTPDLTKFESELSACTAIENELKTSLYTGGVDINDPEFGIEAYRTKLKNAGVDKVTTELQKQYLTWLEEK